MPILTGQRLVVLDVETTGWRPRHGDTLLEVGRVIVEDGAITDTWSTLVGPSRPVPAEVAQIHGITEEMLAGAPEPYEVARALCADCAGLTLVFHNAAFDLSFLSVLLRTSGLSPLYGPVIDTLGLARGLFGSGGNSLAELQEKLELPSDTFHRALGDARTTARILLALAPRWEAERGVRTLDQLAAASQDAIRDAARRAAALRRAAAAAQAAADAAGQAAGSPPEGEPAGSDGDAIDGAGGVESAGVPLAGTDSGPPAPVDSAVPPAIIL